MMDPSEPENDPLLGAINGSNSDIQPIEQSDYHVYKRRWFILSVVALLNLSNGIIWISFGPIADVAASYYDVSLMEINWLAVTFMIGTVPVGFFAAWLLDTYGLRSAGLLWCFNTIGLLIGTLVLLQRNTAIATILLSAWLNVTGAILRVVSTVDIPVSYKFPMVMTGQTLAACAQPLVMFAPTKLAALWFADNQRATANMIASIANPAGILVANLVSPRIVPSVFHSHQIHNLMIYYLIPAAIAALMATFGICSSVPPTPPTPIAGEDSETFIAGLKKIAKNGSYWVLAISFGAGIGIFTALSTLLEQILRPHHYSDNFAGLCGALLFGVGIAGAAIASLYVDRTKKFEELAKSCFAMSSVCLIAFTLIVSHPHMEVWIAVSLSFVGLFGFALYPVCLELAVETTYPVAEATSSGFLIIMGQVESMLFIFMMQFLAKPIDTTMNDFRIANIGFGAAAAVASILFIIFFKCKYHRLHAEQQIVAERILNYSHHVEYPTLYYD